MITLKKKETEDETERLLANEDEKIRYNMSVIDLSLQVFHRNVRLGIKYSSGCALIGLCFHFSGYFSVEYPSFQLHN